MSGPPPAGNFQIKEGIRLIQTPGGGILIQSNPLRALKINRAALDLLDQCRSGLKVSQGTEGAGSGTLAFLDMFVQAGILAWVPPKPQVLPEVSIVIPVYNRPREIHECLASLQSLDYPADKVEVIVVDDASQDHTISVVRQFNARLITQPINQGQSAARNKGVAAAKGEIVAFLDSDCIADPRWLQDLIPYFQDPRVALVGGCVDAYYREKRMDRYEQVCSALNMGSQPVMGRGNTNVFYVPTCNMLVRKAAYTQTGGLDERLRLGEDVDLCWRLMAAGHHLLYQPKGIVWHKHRNHLWIGLRRRFDYGTSEAVLYARFPKIRKQFPWQPGGLSMILAGVAALATQSWFWLMLLAGLPVFETGCKKMQLRRKLGIRLPVFEILGAVLKSHFQLIYYLAFYLVRYHLLLVIALAMVYPGMRWFWLAVILCPVLVTYLKKRPKLSLPVFGFFYLAEHAFYQWGAFLGCLRQKSFRLYGLSFRYAGFLHKSKKSVKGRSVAVNKPSKVAASG